MREIVNVCTRIGIDMLKVITAFLVDVLSVVNKQCKMFQKGELNLNLLFNGDQIMACL